MFLLEICSSLQDFNLVGPRLVCVRHVDCNIEHDAVCSGVVCVVLLVKCFLIIVCCSISLVFFNSSSVLICLLKFCVLCYCYCVLIELFSF